MLQSRASLNPARKQFIAIALLTVLINVVFQFLLTTLWSASSYPLLRALSETVAVAVFVVPPAYYFYIRPLYISLTDRHAAEMTLRKSEMHHRIVSELTTTFVFDLLVDQDGRVSLDFVSDNFYAFAGRSREDGRSFESLFSHVHPDDGAALMENLHRLASKPQSTEIECRAYVRDHDEPRWLALCGKSEWSEEQGRVTVIYGAVTDITERKLAEHALRERDELFALFIRHSPIYAYIKEVSPGESRVLQASENFFDMIGIEGSKMAGKTMEELFPPDFAAKTTADDWDVVSKGSVLRLEEDLNGRSYATIKFPIFQGGKGLLAGYTMDITESKQMQGALKESEEKSRSIIEQSAEGIAVTDANGAIAEWNKAQETITGLTRSSVIGVPAWDVEGMSTPPELKTPERIAQIREKVRGLLRGDRSFTANEKLEHPIALPDGSSRIVSEHVFVVRKNVGNMIVSIVNDITEAKRAEKEKAILEQYLTQAQKMESLGVFAGGIAHDFNNLLAGVYGFMDLARSRVEDQLAREYLSHAAESMERARGLTQHLLTFAKGGEPIRKATPISPLIRETVQFAASGSSVKCNFNVPEDLWPCNIDRNQIGQVIQNITLNAVQAMPLGGTLEVTGRNVALQEADHASLKRGNYVVLSITDQGIGISREMMPRIYDPFFTTKSKGHGLGLSTSYSIVKRHEGAIDVESELGKGSTFQVYLPAGGESPSRGAEPLVLSHQGTGTILVMDDEPSVRLLLSRMLESAGYSVLCKENGGETITCFKEEAKRGGAFSAVILDLTIPGGIGGREVAEEIGKVRRDIPLFVSSGYAEDPIIANPMEYGFRASLRKPFEKAQLMEMLEKHMGKRA